MATRLAGCSDRLNRHSRLRWPRRGHDKAGAGAPRSPGHRQARRGQGSGDGALALRTCNKMSGTSLTFPEHCTDFRTMFLTGARSLAAIRQPETPPLPGSASAMADERQPAAPLRPGGAGRRRKRLTIKLSAKLRLKDSASRALYVGNRTDGEPQRDRVGGISLPSRKGAKPWRDSSFRKIFAASVARLRKPVTMRVGSNCVT